MTRFVFAVLGLLCAHALFPTQALAQATVTGPTATTATASITSTTSITSATSMTATTSVTATAAATAPTPATVVASVPAAIYPYPYVALPLPTTSVSARPEFGITYRVDSCEFLKKNGIPVFGVDHLTERFGSHSYGPGEVMKVMNDVNTLCAVVNYWISELGWTVARLKREGLYITVDPKEMSLVDIYNAAIPPAPSTTATPSTTTPPPAAPTWARMMRYLGPDDMGTLPNTHFVFVYETQGGAAIRFAKPFADGLDWNDQMAELRNFSNKLGVPFVPANALELTLTLLMDKDPRGEKSIFSNSQSRTFIPIGVDAVLLQIGYGNHAPRPVFVQGDPGGGIHQGIVRSWKIPL